MLYQQYKLLRVMIMEKKSTRVLLTTLVCVVSVALIIGVIAIFYYFIYSPPVPENTSEDYGIEGINVEEYFQENSEIVAKIPVKDSKTINNEKEALNNYTERGFSECTISTNYDIDGNYGDSVEITDSSEKHPYYETIFVTSTNELWNVMEVNGTIIANPLSYNEQSTRGAPILITEKETITSYDNKENVFYETIPNESEVIVITVDRIDAETLENLTVEEINKL